MCIIFIEVLCSINVVKRHPNSRLLKKNENQLVMSMANIMMKPPKNDQILTIEELHPVFLGVLKPFSVNVTAGGVGGGSNDQSQFSCSNDNDPILVPASTVSYSTSFEFSIVRAQQSIDND
jgi:hypothetical protein